MNGHATQSSEARVRDAEEFELEGLMSEDEDREVETPTTGKRKGTIP